jgi:phage terminase large subunit-like protein
VKDTREDKIALLDFLEEENRRKRENRYLSFFPDEGEFARKCYPKHIAFLQAGAKYSQRAFIAANQVGKTTAGSYETALHLTGLYPDWWEGKRFNHAINSVAAGDTSKTTRDIQQRALLGSALEIGTGMIPKHTIVRVIPKAGTPDAVDKVYVKHISGGISCLTFKSYDQGREAFQGTTEHVAWLDEEPSDARIYSEVVTRTATTSGTVICTFTPLSGLSEVVLSFLPDGAMPIDGIANAFKFVVMASWDDVPLGQISQEKRKELMSSYLPYEIEARTKGIPCIGAGKVYPVSEADFVVEPFNLPHTWPRMYGLDPGWQRTGAVFAAIDPNTNTTYVYAEYYRAQAEPSAHAATIRAYGAWMNGVIDYAGANQTDGRKVKDQFLAEGLNLYNADKSVEAGILCVYRALCEGRLKVFNNCSNWLKEFRVYRYDDKGNVVKKNDHLMDPTRYVMMNGGRLAETPPEDPLFSKAAAGYVQTAHQDTITGY